LTPSNSAGTPIYYYLPVGDSWNTSGVSISASGAVTSASVTANTAATGTTGGILEITTGFPVASSGAAQITVSGLQVTTSTSATTADQSAIGAQDISIYVNGVSGTGSLVTSSASVGTIGGSVTTIAGATADATVAAEFEAAFPNGNTNVVLATDTPHTNGSDALAASYLEGQLHTGLLITPATSLGTDAQLAMQIMGVTTVYVVGGPLAISPAVIAQIQALPAYNKGGITKTGSNVQVVGPIYGADGTAAGTAAAIATYFGASNSIQDIHGGYTAGAYNDTTGSQSSTAPTSGLSTAFVVASSDWQDAMTLAPLAYALRIPVILNGDSSSTTLSTTASTALTTLGVKQVIIVGGQLALQNSVEAQIEALGISTLRVAGIDATDTAAKIANFAMASATTHAGFGWAPTTVIASHADYWTDALGAAALGGLNQEPVILVESPLVVGSYTTAELGTLKTAGVYNLTVLGGSLAMPSSTVATLLAGL
jgi:putative cell wall-binding protein